MKITNILSAGLFATLLMTSCGKEKVKILSNEIEGDLKGCFQVLDSICEVQKDPEGNPAIVVNIKRTDESVPYTPQTIGVFGEETQGTLVLGGIGYEGYNEEGENIGDLSGEDNAYAKKEQLDILKLATGAQGKLTITFGKEVPSSVTLTSELEFLSTGEIELNGAIGRYGIKNFSIDFNYTTKRITGQYQYLTSPAGRFLYLIGKIANTENEAGDYTTNIYVAEDNGKQELSGIFKGQLKLVRDSKTSPYYYVMAGTFRNKHYDDFRYDLKSAPLTEIKYGDVLKNSYASSMDPSFINEDFSSYGFGSFDKEVGLSAYNSHGDASVDEFIRQYKKFFRQYIKVAKKMQAGDPTVTLEYVELVKEYSKYAEAISNMQGELSPSQLQEIMKMQSEIMSMMK